MNDYLDAFRALGFSTRTVSRAEAERAGEEGYPPTFVLDINVREATRLTLAHRGIPYVALLLDQLYCSADLPVSYPMGIGASVRMGEAGALGLFLEGTVPRLVPTRRRLDEASYLFACAPELVTRYQKLGYPHVAYLPFGANLSRFRPLELTNVERQQYGSDVSFVGTPLIDNPLDGFSRILDDMRVLASTHARCTLRLQALFAELKRRQEEDLVRWQVPELLPVLERKHHVVFVSEEMTAQKETWMILFGVHFAMRQRVEAVRRLGSLGVAVWGDAAWSKVQARGVEYRGRADHDTVLPKILNASKINVNVSKIMFDTGLGPRVFETLACGGFLLTNRNTALSTLFVDGRDLVVYETLDDLVDKARYYLAHESERRAIAERGMQTVWKRHGLLERVTQVVEALTEEKVVAAAA
jgi:spore maturation protein CgeB